MNDQTAVVKDKYYNNDMAFNELYPLNIRKFSSRHWTPIHIAKLASDFLGNSGSKILDIGSGSGKFCLLAGHSSPEAYFYGVEQRKYLVDHALKAKWKLGLENVSFINANITQINFMEFDHFYFYNSFYENLDDSDRIDEDIDYSTSLYTYYAKYLNKELQQKPKGTKVVTYHSFLDEIPMSYDIVSSQENGNLVFWIKR